MFWWCCCYISCSSCIWTRKASCRWQTRATLAKRLHGLCIEQWGCKLYSYSLPIDSLHMVSYYRPIVTLCVKCTVFEMLPFNTTVTLKPGSGVTSRSSKLTPFDSLHMVSYYHPIVTLCLKCTVFETWRHIGRKSPKSYPTLIWHVPLGWPLANFSTSIPCQKLESWGYRMVYISRSCFRSPRHNTGVWRTDRQTDTSLSQRPR